MKERSTNTPLDRPVVDSALFVAFAILITWGTGMLIVLSTHADLVNGAHPVQRPIGLPKSIAISLMMISAFGPFLAAMRSAGFVEA